jgi:hypothetical protein
MSDAELIKPDYWDGALLASAASTSPLFGADPVASYDAPGGLYRLTREDAPRLYFARKPVRTFPSVTSVIHATCPTSPFLIKWIAERGLRQAEYHRDERAAYGTCFHKLFSVWLTNKLFDLAAMKDWVSEYAKDNMVVFDTGYWAEDLKQDLVGFAGFCRDYNVRPVGIEVPFASDDLGYAGTLDLVGLIDLPDSPKGKVLGAKNVLAYIDWKSNRDSFYDDQEVQVNAYRALWNNFYPTAPITSVFLYGPRDWDARSKVRYRFQDCTDSQFKDLFPNLLEQFNVRNPKRGLVLELDGVVELGKDPDALATFAKIEQIIERLDAI